MESFPKALNVTTFLLLISGFPLSTPTKGKPIFKLILTLQICAIFNNFYGLYEYLRTSEAHFGLLKSVLFLLLFMVNAVTLHLGLVLYFYRKKIALLIQKLDSAFAEFTRAPLSSSSGGRFLRNMVLQQNVWLFVFLAQSTQSVVSAWMNVVDGHPEGYLAFVRIVLGNLNLCAMYGVSMLTMLVMMSAAFLFDHSSRFEVDHDFTRLTHLIRTHRKYCDIARSSNEIFKSVVSAIFVFSVFGLIVLFAVIFGGFNLSLGVVAPFTAVYLAVFVYVSLRSADVNNKLNASVDHILAVGSSFDSPILTTKKSFALMAKLDLYATHVTLSECYLSNGGFIQIKNSHIVTILGCILSYVVLLINKHSEE